MRTHDKVKLKAMLYKGYSVTVGWLFRNIPTIGLGSYLFYKDII